ncbi:MAG: hypothetical protein ABJG78_02025 [Cyclobacteriaceae bacterium]
MNKPLSNGNTAGDVEEGKQSPNHRENGAFSLPIPNLIVFIFAVFIIASWVNYHLDLPWVAALFGFVNVFVAVFAFVKDLFTKEDQSLIMQFYRRLLKICLHPASLMILVFVILFVCNFFASIRIYKGGITEKLDATMMSEGSDEPKNIALKDPNAIVNTVRFTNPFGRSYLLEVDGYRSFSFELYPWTGKRIKIQSDLKPAPSLFLRLLPFPGDLKDGTLKLVIDADTVGTYAFDGPDNGAIMIGKRKPILSQYEKNWKNELLLKNAAFEALSDQLTAGWLNYKHENLNFPLPENTLMKAFFYNHLGNLIAKNEFLITEEPLQDYLLE